MKALGSFETPEITRPARERNIPEGLGLKERR